ncbi:hypothetical protein EGYY_11220 [Eggerthella sp. YY7918]|nr:hypothetical protein EGYY_11220 [Eggerthella sp. YY7918]
MVDVQIYVVEPQVGQAHVQHVRHMLPTIHACVKLLVAAWQELGGYHHLVAVREVAQRTTKELLACAALVAHRRVEEGDARLKALPDNGARSVFVKRPRVLPPRCIAEAHATHAHARNHKIGRS